MNLFSLRRLAMIESGRWFREPAILIVVGITLLASPALTYFAVGVAAGLMSSGTGGLQIETTTTLGQASTDADLASFLRSSLVLVLPVASIVIGVRFAASEMASGALLTIGIAVRRLRLVFAIRALVVGLILTIVAALCTVVVSSAAQVALSARDDLGHLSAWTYGGALLAGAVVQSAVIGVIAFALSALSRRWAAVLIAAIVYAVVLEPMVQNIGPAQLTALPRAATSNLVSPDPAWVPAVPTILAAATLAVLAVVSLRRDRAFR